MYKSSKAVKFLLENFDEIAALEEVVNVARNELKVGQLPFVIEVFWSTLRSAGYLDERSYCFGKSESMVWWSPKEMYDSNKEKGIYLFLDIARVMNTIAGFKKDKYHLFLGFDWEDNAANKRLGWINTIKQKSSIWDEFGFEPLPFLGREDYLLGCSIDIAALRKSIETGAVQEMKEGLVERIKAFAMNVRAEMSPSGSGAVDPLSTLPALLPREPKSGKAKSPERSSATRTRVRARE